MNCKHCKYSLEIIITLNQVVQDQQRFIFGDCVIFCVHCCDVTHISPTQNNNPTSWKKNYNLNWNKMFQQTLFVAHDVDLFKSMYKFMLRYITTLTPSPNKFIYTLESMSLQYVINKTHGRTQFFHEKTSLCKVSRTIIFHLKFGRRGALNGNGFIHHLLTHLLVKSQNVYW